MVGGLSAISYFYRLSLNGGSPVTLASNTYDDLGRLQTKNLGGADVTTYTYNVRSWITGISGNKFTENLYPCPFGYAMRRAKIGAGRWDL